MSRQDAEPVGYSGVFTAVRRPRAPRPLRIDADRTVQREAGFSLLETRVGAGADPGSARRGLRAGAPGRVSQPGPCSRLRTCSSVCVMLSTVCTPTCSPPGEAPSWSRPGRSAGSCRRWCRIGSDCEPLPGSIDARGPASAGRAGGRTEPDGRRAPVAQGGDGGAAGGATHRRVGSCASPSAEQRRARCRDRRHGATRRQERHREGAVCPHAACVQPACGRPVRGD